MTQLRTNDRRKKQFGSRTTVAAAASAALVLGLVCTATPAGATPVTASPSTTSTQDEPMLSYTVHATDGDPAGLGAQLAAAGFDVVGRDGDALTVLGTAAIRTSLAAQPGVAIAAVAPYSIPAVIPGSVGGSQDAILPSRLDGMLYPTFYGGYRTVDGFFEFEDDLADAYPELVRVYDYGTSWSGDNPLRVVCVTADAADGCQLDPESTKPRFLIVGQTHARELTTSELAWRYLSYLVDKYGKRADVTALLDSTEVWIAPQVNPDGTEHVQEGIEKDGLGGGSAAWQRKNMNDSYSETSCGDGSGSQEGVDINRNFDVDWGRTGTSKNPCSQTYGGPEADSEPETSAQEALFTQLYRDRRDEGTSEPAPDDTTGGMLTLHSYANQVLLPWGFTTDHTPNDVGLRSFAFRMSYFNNFAAGQAGEILYNSSGATEDWLYDQLGVAGFTWEIGPNGGECAGFFPPYTCQDFFWDQNRDGLMYTGAASAQPYTMTLGPTTTSVKAKLKNGKKIKLRAIADDGAYGQSGVGRPAAQKIKAGRIYIGTAPWDGGTPVTLKVKGSGTSGKLVKKFAAGKKKRLGYVQGKDADGNWGPVQAVWLPKKK